MKRCMSVLIVSLLLALCLLPAFALADTVDLSTLSNEELLALWEAAGERLKAVGAYPYIALGKGDEGTDVTHLQQRLTDLYFYSGDLTGKFDSNTQKAVKAFEKANQLESDGAMSIDEQQLLYSDAAQAKTTPTPSPSPTPVPTPIPDNAVLSITKIKLYDYYQQRVFSVDVQNNASSVTIKKYDIVYRCFNAYDELISKGLLNQEGILTSTSDDNLDIKPGKKYSMKSRFWYLFAYESTSRIEVAIKRYLTTDGETITIPPEDYQWVEGNL